MGIQIDSQTGQITLIDDADEKRQRVIGKGEDLDQIAAEFFGPPVLPVPSVVSARQLKLALHIEGLLDGIEAFVTSQNKAVQISWQTTSEYHREDAMLNGMADEIGMPKDHIDRIFRLAESQ